MLSLLYYVIKARPPRILMPILFALVGLTMSGCSELGYYAQAAKGQIKILAQREDIDELIAHPQTAAELRRRLQRVAEIRKFAITQLGLPDNNAYTSYHATQREYVVWNVLAAPKYSVSLKNWCFPIAGCVAYKGYFSQSGAAKLQQRLQQQGYDTFLYGVSAYSTLGWFSDPVLDTFIDYPQDALAGLLFHELAHQVVYVKDDSAFNEAFATAVEHAGLSLWRARLIGQGDDVPPSLHQVRAQKERLNEREITAMVLEFRQQLEQMYQVTPESDLAEQKQNLFKQLKNRYKEMQLNGQGTPFYDWWHTLDLNNAHLAAVSTYHEQVPGFTQALENAASFPDFYTLIKEISKLPKNERDLWLKQLIDSAESNLSKASNEN